VSQLKIDQVPETCCTIGQFGNAIYLVGPEPADRVTRIMVTLLSSAATNPTLVRELVERGMNIARINCAHDDTEAWRSMAGHVGRQLRRPARLLDRDGSCRTKAPGQRSVMRRRANEPNA
jgi:hypothetical protein